MSSTVPGQGQRIAVVGGGAAGLTAAWLLHRRHDVTLFERASRPGGHVRTITVAAGRDAGTRVDAGFIVFNDRNYPQFTRLLEALEVPWRWSDMSFSYACDETGLEYAGTGLDGLFAQRRNLLSPSYWSLLRGIMRFCRVGRERIGSSELSELTLGQFLTGSGVPERVIRDYVLPMGSAIWSGTREDIRAVPAEMFLRFFDNHGLMRLADRPRWKTVVGGSRSYVDRLLERFSGTVVCGAAIASIRRHDDRVEVRARGADSMRFDQVVIAAHADEALTMLADPSPTERELLGAWRYSHNRTLVHTDRSVMPRRQRAWASWNYRRARNRDDEAPVAVTYYMNRLQGLETEHDFFVTLNPTGPVDDRSIVAEIDFTHPVYDFPAVRTQARLAELNGGRRTWFCGAYHGNGFHEDAVRSGAAVAAAFGESL
jgi:predicted NAD/FAD-binding protein